MLFFSLLFSTQFTEKKKAKRNEYNINNGKVIVHSVGATFTEVWLKIFVAVHFDAVVVFDSTVLFTQNEN